MTARQSREVHEFADLDALSEAAAAEIAAIAKAAISSRGRFSIALAGGNTPRRTHEILAERYGSEIDWSKTDVIFGDERFVPDEDPRSNYRMARETLLSRVPIPAANVHSVRTDLPTVDAAANEYERTLRALLPPGSSSASRAQPTADLVLLGVGPDGHTASLFPGSPIVAEKARWVRAVDAPTAVMPAVPRITTTLPFLDCARAVMYLVAGADKRPVIAQILEGAEAAQRYPAAMVKSHGRTLWLLDRSAVPSTSTNA